MLQRKLPQSSKEFSLRSLTRSLMPCLLLMVFATIAMAQLPVPSTEEQLQNARAAIKVLLDARNQCDEALIQKTVQIDKLTTERTQLLDEVKKLKEPPSTPATEK